MIGDSICPRQACFHSTAALLSAAQQDRVKHFRLTGSLQEFHRGLVRIDASFHRWLTQQHGRAPPSCSSNRFPTERPVERFPILTCIHGYLPIMGLATASGQHDHYESGCRTRNPHTATRAVSQNEIWCWFRYGRNWSRLRRWVRFGRLWVRLR